MNFINTGYQISEEEFMRINTSDSYNSYNIVNCPNCGATNTIVLDQVLHFCWRCGKEI